MEEAVTALRRAFPHPPPLVRVEWRRLLGKGVRQAVAGGDELGDARGAVGFGLARVGVVLTDVRAHAWLPWAWERSVRWRRRVSAARHRSGEYRTWTQIGKA